MANKLASASKQPTPKEGETVIYDEGRDKVRGLALRVRSTGARTWCLYYRYDGKQKRVGLGDVSDIDLKEAREKASQLRQVLNEGRDPALEKVEKREAAKLTVGKCIADYLAVRAEDMKPRSLDEITRHLNQHWKPLHPFPLNQVTRGNVAARLRELGREHGLTGANRARSTLSAFYAWAIAEDLADENVVAGTRKNKEKARSRVLSDAELVKIWQAAGDSTYGRIVRLLMLTGQRRDEIGGLRWGEVEKGKLVFPESRTKNSREHLVPLSAPAQAIIDSMHRILGRECVFSEADGFGNWSAEKAALDERCGVKGWTIHDLRRTAATRMADLGVQPHHVEAVLNHVSGHKAGVAGIYNRSSYYKEKAEALDLWASHLMVELAKAEGGNIRRLERARN
jgi:integrase